MLMLMFVVEAGQMSAVETRYLPSGPPHQRPTAGLGGGRPAVAPIGAPPPDVQPKGRKKGSSPNQHHWDEIEPIYFALRKAGGTKNGSAKQALKQLNLEILPRSPDLSSAKSAYIATDERSALNSIVVEMDKREISRAL